MTYIIRSADGQTTICTACSVKAAEHAQRLLEAGRTFTIRDINGDEHDAAGLIEATKPVPFGTRLPPK